MKDKTILLGFLIFTISVIAAGLFILTKSSTPAVISASQNAKVEAGERTYDWGRIDYKKGNVTKTFTIKNVGTDPLKLTNVKTSCACTKAQITIDGKTSPFFGMHTTSSWVGEVPRDKEAKIEIIFDPQFHGPQSVGAVTRLITIETNDASLPKLEFSLTGVVVND